MDNAAIMKFLQDLVGKFPIVAVVLAILGSLVVLGGAVVAVTPSKEDDAAWDKIKAMPVVGFILNLLANFSPIQKK